MKRRLDVGIPDFTVRFPRLLVPRRHRRGSTGVEHEHRWAHLAKCGFGELRIGCIAGDDRDTVSGLELGEARGVACGGGDVGTHHEKNRFKRLVENGWLQDSPAKPLKSPKPGETNVVPFCEEEVEKTLKACDA